VHRSGEQLALAVRVVRAGGDPLLNVADERLEPGENLGLRYVGGDRCGITGAARFADRGADVLAARRKPTRVQRSAAMAAETDPAQQIVLNGAPAAAAPLVGDRIETT
jgi:hypothetical protein